MVVWLEWFEAGYTTVANLHGLSELETMKTILCAPRREYHHSWNSSHKIIVRDYLAREFESGSKGFAEWSHNKIGHSSWCESHRYMIFYGIFRTVSAKKILPNFYDLFGRTMRNERESTLPNRFWNFASCWTFLLINYAEYHHRPKLPKKLLDTSMISYKKFRWLLSQQGLRK